MASTSPSPNSPPLSLPPPPAATSQPNQTAGIPPPANQSTPAGAPPPQSPAPPSPAGAPPPGPPLVPPVTATPPLSPSVTATPPAASNLSPPPPPSPPETSPPPPNPPENYSPPPNPPENFPPTPTPPENSSPPPNPPENSSPPPNPPENSSPPPNPPENSSPPPNPPENSSPPPNPPENSPSGERLTPPIASTSPPPPSLAPPGTQLPPSSPNRPTERSTNGTETATSSGSSGGSKTGGVVAIGLVVGFVVIGFLVMAVWYRRRQKRRRVPNLGYIMPSPFASSQNSESLFLRSQKPSTSPPGSNFIYSPEHGSRAWFTYEELSRATNGFAGHNLLGEGGFGCVYKGVLEDGQEVAVKQLKIGGGQGEREFRAEVEIISRVHHRHLVSLVGYCIHEHQRLLVYQYVPNDTLHYHLHGEGRRVMDWATRIKVAAGAARGLAYLHEDCHPRIIHRDIKSSNILLDNDFDAQVADFGLAKLAMDTDTHVTTRVMGTFGYMAPEYASSGKLTEKSDVFSFGVLLLELITGRKPVDASQPLGDESLVEWARPLLIKALDNQQFEELVDPRLGDNYVRAEMFRMIEAAAACIRHLAPKRPRMSQVVRALDSIVEFTTDLSNGMKPGQSEVYDSRDQSAQIRLFQRMAFGSQDFSSEYYYNNSSSV